MRDDVMMTSLQVGGARGKLSAQGQSLWEGSPGEKCMLSMLRLLVNAPVADDADDNAGRGGVATGGGVVGAGQGGGLVQEAAGQRGCGWEVRVSQAAPGETKVSVGHDNACLPEKRLWRCPTLSSTACPSVAAAHKTIRMSGEAPLAAVEGARKGGPCARLTAR